MSDNGFALARDIIEVHGERGNASAGHRLQSGVAKRYRSLSPASFVLTFAAAEHIAKAANKSQGFVDKDGRPHGIHWSELVERWEGLGVPLRARARVTPQPGATTGIHKWMLLEGANLHSYLGDVTQLRNNLVHRGSTTDAKLTSGYFAPQGESLKSMRLMLAEGFLQAAQDICYLMSGSPTDGSWDYVAPRRSGTSGMSKRFVAQSGLPE